MSLADDTRKFAGVNGTRAQLRIIPQCGHWTLWEQTDEFNRIALSFFGTGQ